MTKQRHTSGRLGIFLLVGALVLLIDSILNYPIRLQGASGLPWSILTVPCIAIYLYANRNFKPLKRVFGLFALVAICGTVSITSPEEDRGYFIQLPLIVSSFLLGVCIAEDDDTFEQFSHVIVLGLSIQAIVALLFFFRVLPIIPGELAFFSAGGVVYERPAYTVDQNYQAIYWTLAPTLLLYRSTLIKLLGLLICSIFVIALLELGSRSGLLVFFLSVALSGLMAVIRGFKSKIISTRIVVLAFFGSMLCFYAMSTESFASYANEINERWFVLSARSNTIEGGETVFQRLESLFFFGRVFWESIFPLGLQEFIEMSGTVPHFSPTTLLLLYGWFGVALWAIWLGYPASQAAFRLIGAKLTFQETAVFIGFLTAIAAILTLPSPFTKVIWLLAGIVSVRTSLLRQTPKALR